MIEGDVLEEVLKGCVGPGDLLGAGGLMKGLKTALIERMLRADLTDPLGDERGQEAPPSRPTRRNQGLAPHAEPV